MYTDKQPQPYSLMVGMGFTLVGLLLMSQANTYPLILLAAALIGMGSSVFHPEASRVARMAAGGRYGLAQSLFQVGGNMGSAAGPLLAAFIVVPARPAEHRVVLGRRAGRHDRAVPGRRLVRARPRRPEAGGAQGRRRGGRATRRLSRGRVGGRRR